MITDPEDVAPQEEEVTGHSAEMTIVAAGFVTHADGSID